MTFIVFGYKSLKRDDSVNFLLFASALTHILSMDMQLQYPI
ncbi:hypothetical protein JCM19235_3858 [Vibrio maritimus]|uniref:Uncharacterized protein n=1 Tax=Vibrio maritimus TaxID=990268 RepID=A0A090RZX6_9VIBR|nr:hypothetical protein JCM19235_3858 [Vibrio maritimus]